MGVSETKHKVQDSLLEVDVLSNFSLLLTEKNKPKQPSKIKIPHNNINPLGFGELGRDLAERTTETVVDP